MSAPTLGTIDTSAAARQANATDTNCTAVSRTLACRHALLVAELLLLGVIVVLAAYLRARLLGDVPRYTDEVNETMSAIDIARGRIMPLVSPTRHIGAWFNYVLAGTILLFGKSVDLPRQVALTMGLATLGLTYGYARRLGGSMAGLAAAGLLAVSAPHVLLSSRVAWSASSTPLLFAGATWALDVAVSSRRPSLVPLAGLLAGLALQAHPSVLALLPGFALFVLVRGRWLLRRPELYLGGTLFLLGCANVVIYNVQTQLGTVRSVQQEYPGEAFGPAAYLENIGAPARGIALALASAVDATHQPAPTDPTVLLIVGVCLAALVYTARRQSMLPMLVLLSALACFPFIHDDFDPLLKARYTMPLVPLTYVAVGVLVAGLLTHPRITRLGLVSRLGIVGLWLALAASLLGSLLRFETESVARGCTNAAQRALVAEMEQHRRPGEWVLLDQGLVRPAERLGYLWLLEGDGRKVGDVRLLRGGIWDELIGRQSFLTVVNDKNVAMAFEKQGLPLLTPNGPRPVRDNGKMSDGNLGLYRVTPDGAVLLASRTSPSCDQIEAS